MGEQNGVSVLNETKCCLFPCRSTKEISELKNILKQLQPGALGRSARMVLSAARRVPPASMAGAKTSPEEPGPSQPATTGESPPPAFGSLLSLAPPFFLNPVLLCKDTLPVGLPVGEKTIASVLLLEEKSNIV